MCVHMMYTMYVLIHRDTLSLCCWAKHSQLLAVGTAKGNLLLYNHRRGRCVCMCVYLFMYYNVYISRGVCPPCYPYLHVHIATYIVLVACFYYLTVSFVWQTPPCTYMYMYVHMYMYMLVFMSGFTFKVCHCIENKANLCVYVCVCVCMCVCVCVCL